MEAKNKEIKKYMNNELKKKINKYEQRNKTNFKINENNS